LTEIPDEWRAWAEQEDPNLDVQVGWENFVDYWQGVAGAKGCKANWLATWRNNVRSLRDMGKFRKVKAVKAGYRSFAQTGKLSGSDEFLAGFCDDSVIDGECGNG